MPYSITNSACFNTPDSPDLKRLPSSTGSSVQATLSTWVKFATDDTEVAIMGGWDNSGANDDDGYMVFKRLSSGELQFNGGDDVYLKTSAKYRDVTAWYHLVLAIFSGHNTADYKQRLYVNGQEITNFATRNNLSNLQDLPMNTTAGNDDAMIIGADEDTGGKGSFFNGYIAETHWIDGTQKVATDFGEFDSDTGIWVPKAYSGSYGTNGFFLEFKQSGTGADSSGIGADTGGGTHHFTVTGLTALDQCTDTPTNNFCTLNPLDGVIAGATALTQGNRHIFSATAVVRGTLAATAGKWYFEYKQLTATGNGGAPWYFGIASTEGVISSHDNQDRGAFFYSDGHSNGQKRTFEAGTLTYANDTDLHDVDNGDICSVAFDCSTGKVWFARNGTWLGSGNPAGGSNPYVTMSTSGVCGTAGGQQFITICSEHAGVNYTSSFNMGNPEFSISSGNADGNGYGNFEYAVPAHFYALCTKNLAEFGGTSEAP